MECALALQNFHTDGVFSAFSHYYQFAFQLKTRSWVSFLLMHLFIYLVINFPGFFFFSMN